MTVPFVKSHGLGNDYLVLAEWDLPGLLDAPAVRLLCDRHRGPGADGVLLATSRTEPYGVRIFNPDGSEAEKSGNGLRIFAKYLVEHGVAAADAFTIRTLGGEVRAEVRRESAAAARCETAPGTAGGAEALGEAAPGDQPAAGPAAGAGAAVEAAGGAAAGGGGSGRVVSVSVEMGQASFASDAVPVLGPPREAVDEALAVDGRTVRVTALSVGNPHCVVFVDRLDEAELAWLGPRLERHPAFPRRTNVQLARVTAPDRIEVLVWERGAGPTLASGSSACAVAAAAVRLGRAGRRVAVELPGGRLEVEVGSDFSLRLEGPVEEVYEGYLSPDLLVRLGWGGP